MRVGNSPICGIILLMTPSGHIPLSPPSTMAARCLLLLRRGHDAPPDLVRGLHRRHVAVREVHDAPAAMAALARQPFHIFLIVEPAAWPDLTPLAHAVRHYHPAVRLWQYRWSAQPRLRPLDAPQKKEAPLPPPRPRPDLSPRRSGSNNPPPPTTEPDPQPIPEKAPDQPQPACRSTIVLNASELAMLLRRGATATAEQHT